MKRKTAICLLSLPLLLLMAARSGAQQPASGSQDNSGPYNVKSTIEVGVRGVEVNGNKEKFRSDLNYQPGFRLFDSSFLMQSNEVTPGPFDSLLVSSSGWGGDPSGYLRINADKTGWYKFDGTVRRVDYYNSLSNLALNQHISNNEHNFGDFDLTLMPQGRVKVNLGYSFDRNSGLGFTTYDYQRDEFKVGSPFRTQANDFRFGVETTVSVFDLSFNQGLRYFKDDTTYDVTDPPGGFNPGNNPANNSLIRSLHRDLPARGSIPYSRLAVHTFLAKKVDITSRLIYTKSTTDYRLFETITGRDFSNNNVTLDRFNSQGRVERPTVIGDLGVTVPVTDKFRVSDTFRVNVFRINGAQRLMEDLFRTNAAGTAALPTTFVDQLTFSLTNYRRFLNTIEGDYDFHPRFSAHVGHRYSDRHIENGVLTRNTTAAGELDPEFFDNRTNTIFWGFKARPVSQWSLYFDFERGETDNVFTRTENYDFTNLRLRSIVRPSRTLAINLSLITKDNTNPTLSETVPVRSFGADINTRLLVSSVDWTPNGKFSISSGYTRSHITSEAEIIFFSNSVRQEGLSRYFLRDNFAFFNAYAQVHSRVSLYGAYRIHVDKGQQDRVSAPTVLVGSYPQQFQSPEFRVALKLHDRIDWNVGYQYFDFQERFLNTQRYQSHMPYTSLRIYLNRGNN